MRDHNSLSCLKLALCSAVPENFQFHGSIRISVNFPYSLVPSAVSSPNTPSRQKPVTTALSSDVIILTQIFLNALVKRASPGPSQGMELEVDKSSYKERFINQQPHPCKGLDSFCYIYQRILVISISFNFISESRFQSTN